MFDSASLTTPLKDMAHESNEQRVSRSYDVAAVDAQLLPAVIRATIRTTIWTTAMVYKASATTQQFAETEITTCNMLLKVLNLLSS